MEVVKAAQERKVPIRIGVNSGSLEREILKKHGRPTPEAMLESAMYHASLLEKFDAWVETRGFRNRSEALRELIRRFISESCWEDGEKTVFGTVTLTYDHHSGDSAREITSLQHDFGDLIICSTHIHADHHHCFESVVFHGRASRVKEFIRQLSGLRDVSSSDPVITTIP